MLDKTNLRRMRTRVQGFDECGRVQFTVYPCTTSKIKLCADALMVSDDLDFANLKVGQPFDVLMAGGEAVAIEKKAIHPFDIKSLYPNGLKCLSAVVNQAAEGVYDAITAKARVDGQDKTFRITSLTKMWQAQQDDEAVTPTQEADGQTNITRESIYRSLKTGDSVVAWVDPTSTKAIQDVLYLTVQYR